MLGSTALDVYLLRTTYVTLQSVSSKRESAVIQWLNGSTNILGEENVITIGPVNEHWNHRVVRYNYKVKGLQALSGSSTATLHLLG